MHSLRVAVSSANYCVKNYARACVTSNRTTEAETVKSDDKLQNNILIKRRRGVMLIGINRRERKNSLDIATAEKLNDAISIFEEDKDTSSAVLHGIGGNFCAGYDLKEIANFDKNCQANVPQFGSLANRIGPFKKPIVAALSGYTLGVGLEIALLCDIRVMEETALLGFSNRRFGIPILCGGTVRLPALIGFSRATDLILTGRMLNATDAYSWGLANMRVPCGTALGQAMQIARSLVKFPQKAMLADRTSMYYSAYGAKEFKEALRFEKDNASHLVLEDGINGAKKFVERGIGRHGKSAGIRDEDKNIRDLDDDLI